MEVYTVQGGPSAEVVELIEAARSIALPDCYYDGNNIVLPCWSRADAIRRPGHTTLRIQEVFPI